MMEDHKSLLQKGGIACLVVIAFWLTFNFGYYLRWVESVAAYDFTHWQGLIFIETSKVIFILLVTLVIGRFFGEDSVFAALGIDKNPLPGLLRAFTAVVPMLVGYGVLFSLNPDYSLYEFFAGSFFPGVTEELIYRAFFFGIFFYQLKIGFVPSILLVSVSFGYMHYAQSNILVESVSIFAITAFGSTLFAWLYVEWDKDLWFPIFLHMSMNFAWGLFDTGVETALGGWGLNVFRVLTIIVVITLTIRKIRSTKSITKSTLWSTDSLA